MTDDTPKMCVHVSRDGVPCDEPRDGKGSRYCTLHRSRKAKGLDMDAPRRKVAYRGKCINDEMPCVNQASPKRKGYCETCYQRVKNDKPLSDPLGHRRILSDTGLPTYSTVHWRIRETRGLASQFSCVWCGDRAIDWAYVGGAPDEMETETGYPFSEDQSFYEPMCKPCHAFRDHGHSEPPTREYYLAQKRAWSDKQRRASGVPVRKKLNEDAVREMRARHAQGENIVSLAQEFGVHAGTAREAIVGLTWRHVE